MAAYTTTATNYTMLITKNSGYEISDMRLMSDGVGNTLATSGEDGDVAVSSSDLKRIVSGGTVVGEKLILTLLGQFMLLRMAEHTGL